MSLQSRQTYSGGVATFFYQNGVAGACGTVHSDDDLIAAIDQTRYGDPSQVSSLCGKKVTITNTNNQKTVTVTIADDCPTCDNENSIDLSVRAFTQIATEEEGEVPSKSLGNTSQTRTAARTRTMVLTQIL
ncbi:barwin-like endoglucanase, partial [Gymnopus androsaceus JB14]